MPLALPEAEGPRRELDPRTISISREDAEQILREVQELRRCLIQKRAAADAKPEDEVENQGHRLVAALRHAFGGS